MVILHVLLSLLLCFDDRICAGETKPGIVEENRRYVGALRKESTSLQERVLNLIPKSLPRFPFFTFGGSTAPGECGCKCEFRQVRKYIKLIHIEYKYAKRLRSIHSF